MKITSNTNPYIKELCLLKKASVRKEKKMFLAEGEDFILPAIKAGLAIELFTLEETNYDIKQTLVSENVLKKLSVFENSTSPIVLCKYPSPPVQFGKRLIYLDGVQDPGNVGTIIRTAQAFSYDAVLLSPNSSSIYSQKVISATKGAIFSFPVFENVDLNDFKDKGYSIIATALRGATNYKECPINPPFILVFGSEGQGVSENALNLSSKVVKIEIDSIESLNVAVAAGILMERFRS